MKNTLDVSKIDRREFMRSYPGYANMALEYVIKGVAIHIVPPSFSDDEKWLTAFELVLKSKVYKEMKKNNIDYKDIALKRKLNSDIMQIVDHIRQDELHISHNLHENHVRHQIELLIGHELSHISEEIADTSLSDLKESLDSTLKEDSITRDQISADVAIEIKDAEKNARSTIICIDTVKEAKVTTIIARTNKSPCTKVHKFIRIRAFSRECELLKTVPTTRRQEVTRNEQVCTTKPMLIKNHSEIKPAITQYVKFNAPTTRDTRYCTGKPIGDDFSN